MLRPLLAPLRNDDGDGERGDGLTADALWDVLAARLREALNETTYHTWFADAEGAELSDEAFVVEVPNDFAREWIEGHFLELMRAAVRDTIGEERPVQIRARARGTPPPA